MDTAALTRARLDAASTRAGWLMGIAENMFTVDDLLSAYPATTALGRIKLVDLLAAQPDISHGEAVKRVERFKRFARYRFAKAKKVPETPTVAWLRHRQAGPELRAAWQMALTDFTESPWPGFPHKAKPQ